MTDRVNALIVTLDENIRIDDVGGLIASIEHLRHVISVAPNITDIDSHVAYTRARSELGQKILEVIYPKEK